MSAEQPNLGYRGEEVVAALGQLTRMNKFATTEEVAEQAGLPWLGTLVTLGRLSQGGPVRLVKARGPRIREARWALA